MKYVCLKSIVTKVFDRILDDEEDIFNILEQLQIKEMTCSIQVKGGPMHEKARITRLDLPRFSWRIFQKHSTLDKLSDIKDIEEIRVCTDNDITINLKPEPSRWSSLDIS